MNPITIGAFVAFSFAILTYVMLITAKAPTLLWRITIWLSSGCFALSGCVFLLAKKFHYPYIYGEWSIDLSAGIMIVGVVTNYIRLINVPPAATEDDIERVRDDQKRAFRTLLVGVGVALLIVFSYAVAQPSDAGQPVQAAELKEQASLTRAHIDEGFACLNARLDTMNKNQQTDHSLLMEAYERGLANRERIIKTESRLDQIANLIKRWGRTTQDAIERTRQSIFTPDEIKPEPTGPIPVDRVKKVPPKQFDRKGKSTGFNDSDTTSTRVAHHQR